jgi:tRNA 2-thiouridine synthesizing protein A
VSGEVVVDCVGSPCPVPVVELAKAVRDAQPGQVVVLLADDPAAAVDVAAWCRMKGHDLVGADPVTERVGDLGSGVVTAYRVGSRSG